MTGEVDVVFCAGGVRNVVCEPPLVGEDGWLEVGEPEELGVRARFARLTSTGTSVSAQICSDFPGTTLTMSALRTSVCSSEKNSCAERNELAGGVGRDEEEAE